MTLNTMTRTISEAELFREFIEADKIRKFDWQGKLREAVSIRYLLVEDGEEPDIGEFIEQQIFYTLHNEQSNDGLDFLADEFERAAGQLRFVSQHFDELKAEREVRSDDDAEDSRYRSIADAQSDHVAGIVRTARHKAIDRARALGLLDADIAAIARHDSSVRVDGEGRSS